MTTWIEEHAGLRMNGEPVQIELKTFKEGKETVTYAVLGTAEDYNDDQARVDGFGYLNKTCKTTKKVV